MKLPGVLQFCLSGAHTHTHTGLYSGLSLDALPKIGHNWSFWDVVNI